MLLAGIDLPVVVFSLSEVGVVFWFCCWVSGCCGPLGAAGGMGVILFIVSLFLCLRPSCPRVVAGGCVVSFLAVGWCSRVLSALSWLGVGGGIAILCITFISDTLLRQVVNCYLFAMSFFACGYVTVSGIFRFWWIIFGCFFSIWIGFVLCVYFKVVEYSNTFFWFPHGDEQVPQLLQLFAVTVGLPLC